MVDHVLDLPNGTGVMILAPVVSERKGQHEELITELRAQGFIRLRVNGEIHEIDCRAGFEQDQQAHH